MKYRARCSSPKHHRKTIKGVYDPNDRLSCHVPGCMGKMYFDKTRNKLGSNDGRELCRCDGFAMSIRNAPHRKGCKGCNHREEYLIEKSLRDVSKHAAKPVDDEPPF